MTKPSHVPRARAQKRSLLAFFAVLIVVEAVGLALIKPAGFTIAAYVIMFAPALGALAARFYGPGVIWWGRPSWWILVALLPIPVVLAGYWVSSMLGWLQFSGEALRGSLLVVPFALITTCVAAFGEELGWRGFLWPLLRTRFTFLVATAILTPIWLAYHLPGIYLGVYGTWVGLRLDALHRCRHGSVKISLAGRTPPRSLEHLCGDKFHRCGQRNSHARFRRPRAHW